MTLPAPLAPLAAYRRFVTYMTELDPDRPGKTIKRPTDVRSGYVCNAQNEAHQYSYAEAFATGRAVGFVFVEADGFWFLDIDGALENDPAGGPSRWNAQATELCAALAGAAVEVSVSGTGLHIIGRGLVPPHAKKNVPAKLELYTDKRFCALTGIMASGDASIDLTPQIWGIAERYFPPNASGAEIAGWTDTPCDGYGGPADDEELIRAAMASGKRNAAAAFGTGNVTFADLWLADADKLGAKWPGSNGGYDASHADASLASHLAYWTGKNCERTRTLMLQSALARQKWEDRPDWLELTIMKAASVVSAVAQGRPAVEPPRGVDAGVVTVSTAPTARVTGRDFLSGDEQISFFAGCVYIVDLNKVWIPSTGDMLDKPRFDVVYAGYILALDSESAKTTDSAFEALTKSRVFQCPRVDRACFRPEHPPGMIIQEDGRSLVNVYIPINTKRIAGDASKFLTHMRKLLPVERDLTILLHYIACCIQNPGFKIQWWPLIQGAEGNGKTFIERLIAFCIGSRYSHLVNPEAMAKTGNQFNKWITGHLFVAFEEIYVHNRREMLESFKSTVTNDRLPIEGKGTDQTTGDNRANGLLLSNHREAVPINIDGRRYAIFFTAQQSAADIERDGMGGGYFPDLYDWAYGRGAYAHLGENYGFAVINDYLHTYVLEAELDPTKLCVRAPATSSTALALAYGLGRAEQEIVEAISEGRQGFGGGWISSIAVDKLLDAIRAPVPRAKRRELLTSLGYELHPGLPDGRVAGIVQPDNAKPRLYVTPGHLSRELTDPIAIAKAYTAAQSTTISNAAASRFG